MDKGDGAEDPFPERAVSRVPAWDNVRSRPLIVLQGLDLLDDRRYHLNRAGATPDNSHALVGQIVGVVPLSRVPLWPFKILKLLGDLWDTQGSHTREHNISLSPPALSIVEVDMVQNPLLSPFMPSYMRDLGTELNLLVELVLACGASEVIPDLGLRRIVAGPVVVGLEGESVVVGFDIASTSGVGVGPPGAANIWLELKDGECRDVELCLDPDCRT